MASAKAATSRWDVVDNLGSDKQIAAYLEAALEDGDPQLVTATIGDIARARGMMKLARETGLARKGLYKAFGPNGNPSFATVMTGFCLVRCPRTYAEEDAMAVSIRSLGIDRLGLEERIALVEELWDSIAADRAAVPLTEAQRAELDRRIAAHEANPDDVVSWEAITLRFATA